MQERGKKLFTAVFERYEQDVELLKRKTHFRSVRLSKCGALIADRIVFDKEIAAKIVGYLTIGEHIAFLADVEFKDIEFQYPHELINKQGKDE